MHRFWMTSAALLGAIAITGVVWPEFLDIPSLLVTLGGSLAVTYVSYPKSQLRELLLAIRALFFYDHPSSQDQINELSRLTRVYQIHGLRGLESQERLLPDPFLRCGVGLLVDLHKAERVQAALGHEFDSMLARDEISRQILMTLGRLLPSFGLIGTLIGMVLLLRNLSAQNPQALPAALGLAVLTTLYGAMLANVVVGPLAARLHAISVERQTQMRLIMDWTMMICRGEAKSAIANRLGLLLPRDNPAAAVQRELAPAALPS